MRIPHFQFYLSLCSAMAMMSVEIEIGGEQISARRGREGRDKLFIRDYWSGTKSSEKRW